MKPSFSFFALLAIFCAQLAFAEKAGSAAQPFWPQWRGPMATGVAPMADPPLHWSEDKNVKWKVPIPGFGTSTPIIWENRVFILTAIPTGKKVEAGAAPEPPQATAAPDSNERRAGRRGPGGGRPGGGFGSEKPTEAYQFVVLCLDRQTGKTLWRKVAREQVPHEGHHRDHGYASASPVTDGKHLLAYFGSRGLYCFDLDGNLKWEKDFGQMTTRGGFGEGTSPALHGNTVIIKWDHEGDDFIVALDKNTGEELWRRTREDEPSSWSTPLIVEHEGRMQVITSATEKVRSYDLATGEIIWECSGQTLNVVPSPVSANGIVYALSGFRGNALQAIRLGRTGDLTGTDALLWTHDKSMPYVPSPLLVDGLLYAVSGNNGILSCFDAITGQAHYEAERLQGIYGIYASPVSAKDRVYVLGREGVCLVLKKGPALEILASNKLDGQTDASIAIAGKDLFIRSHEHLYAISEE